MTELFGPVGFGWTYSIDKLWTEPGTDSQVCVFATVSVRINIDGTWSEPFSGIGGNMLIAKESKGLYTSDEAYKMAVTDALSVAFKAVGVAAEIYLGNFDGSKYKNQPEPEPVDNTELIEKYVSACDKHQDVDSLRKWWAEVGKKCKEELGNAEAAKIYAHMVENKKILEGMANDPANG